jgi:hypothetical protein
MNTSLRALRLRSVSVLSGRNFGLSDSERRNDAPRWSRAGPPNQRPYQRLAGKYATGPVPPLPDDELLAVDFASSLCEGFL